eukprot:5539538-Amphidinium_carterae.1
MEILLNKTEKVTKAWTEKQNNTTMLLCDDATSSGPSVCYGLLSGFRKRGDLVNRNAARTRPEVQTKAKPDHPGSEINIIRMCPRLRSTCFKRTSQYYHHPHQNGRTTSTKRAQKNGGCSLVLLHGAGHHETPPKGLDALRRERVGFVIAHP